MKRVLDEINRQYFRTDLPELEVGDEVEVVIKNPDRIEPKSSKGQGGKPSKGSENQKRSLSSFRGLIIARENKNQISYTFSVLGESNKSVIITTKFLYHSPLIVSIKKVGRIRGKVRQGKLYYLERRISGNK